MSLRADVAGNAMQMRFNCSTHSLQLALLVSFVPSCRRRIMPPHNTNQHISFPSTDQSNKLNLYFSCMLPMCKQYNTIFSMLVLCALLRLTFSRRVLCVVCAHISPRQCLSFSLLLSRTRCAEEARDSRHAVVYCVPTSSRCTSGSE